MSFRLIGWPAPHERPARERANAHRFVPCLEALEDRALPVLNVTNLASSTAATALAQSIVGSGVTISNVRFTGTVGSVASAGYVSNGTGILGFEKGIILGSGYATDVIGVDSGDADDGPNGNPVGNNIGLPGDPELDAVAGTSQSYNATVLQFDFIPKGKELTLQYVFGSTEYNGAGTPPTKDDAFAIFLNGSVISLVPGTNTPVGVATVNTSTNNQYFVDNCDEDFNEATPLPTTLSGLTTVLTIETTVTPHVVNHMKIAVEDTDQPVGDSVVFIKAGSLSAGGPVGYKPFRYIYNASTTTYNGNVTVLNDFVLPLSAPIAIAFENLPAKATLVNATGTVTSSNGTTVVPAISLPGVSLAPEQFIRVAVQFTDPPPPVSLSTFFEGYILDILNGASAQAVTPI